MSYSNVERADNAVANAMDYGVVGDGWTDDTVAMERAFGFAAASRRPLFIPPGTYIVDAPKVPSGCHIYGGFGTVLKRRSGATTNRVLHLAGDDITVDGLTIDGNAGTGGGTSNDGAIQVWGVGRTNLEIRGCLIHNTHTHAVRLTDTAGSVRVRDNVIVYGSAAGGYGIVMNSQTGGAPAVVDDVEISRNVLVRHPDCPAGYGMMARGSDDHVTRKMRHVRVEGNSVDLLAPGGGLGIEVWADDTVIAGNVCRGGGYGISYSGEVGAITGNVCHSIDGPGIEAAAGAECRHVTCTSNTVKDCKTGIAAWGSSDHVRIVGNDIDRCEPGIHCFADQSTVADNGVVTYASDGTTTAGIWIQGGHEVTVTGNTVELAADNAGEAPCAIRFTDSSDFICVGNLLPGGGATFDRGVLAVATTVTVNGVVVGNNLRHATIPWSTIVDGGALGDLQVGLNVGVA